VNQLWLGIKPWNHTTTSKPKVVSFEAWGWPSTGGKLAALGPEEQRRECPDSTGLGADLDIGINGPRAPVAKMSQMDDVPIGRFE